MKGWLKTNYRVLRAVLVVVLLAAVPFALIMANRGQCREPYRADTTITIQGTQFASEIVDTATTREKGLSGRSCIPSGQTMLFVFENPGDYGFWMKDMQFPIDMIWLDASKRIVSIQSNVSPSSYPTVYKSASPALYVLELQAGTAKTYHMTLGDYASF